MVKAAHFSLLHLKEDHYKVFRNWLNVWTGTLATLQQNSSSVASARASGDT